MQTFLNNVCHLHRIIPHTCWTHERSTIARSTQRNSDPVWWFINETKGRASGVYWAVSMCVYIYAHRRKMSSTRVSQGTYRLYLFEKSSLLLPEGALCTESLSFVAYLRRAYIYIEGAKRPMLCKETRQWRHARLLWIIPMLKRIFHNFGSCR